MKAIQQLERFQRMHKLIKAESTGTPEEFAYKFRICPSHMHNLIREMKDMGAPIMYSRIRQTYYYTNDDFYRHFKNLPEIKRDKQLKNIFGGGRPDNFSPVF